MKIVVVGASKGLGKAFTEGLCKDGDTIIGISRKKPVDLRLPAGANLDWIEVDMSNPMKAVSFIQQQVPSELDVIIYNLGLWEADAFTEDYCFLDNPDDEIINMVSVNITSAILLLKRLVPIIFKVLETTDYSYRFNFWLAAQW